MRHRHQNPHTLGAIVVIAVGVMLLLNQNGILRFEDIWRLWPLLLVVAGAVRLTQSTPNARMTGGLMMAVGIVLELSEFHLIPYPIWTLWPIGIIAVGLLLLWRSLQPREYDDPPAEETSPRECDGRQFRRRFRGAPAGHVSIFGGGERRFSSTDFEHADVLAIFGGYKLDLRKATMKGAQATVDAVALFGGVEIVVPENWNVIVHGVGIFGGYADESHHSPAGDSAPELIVDGVALFGGVQIKN